MGASQCRSCETGAERTFRILLVLILGLHAGLLADSASRHSATVDEGGHILSGLDFWTTGEFSTYLVNPPVAKLWQSLPVLLAQPVVPYDPEALFVHDWEPQHDVFLRENVSFYHFYILLARLSIIPVSAVGLVVVAIWSKELFGRRSGVLAAVFWATNPGFVGWGSIANVDIASASAGITAMYAVRKWLIHPDFASTVAAGGILGFAQLVKFTHLLLYPSILIVFGWMCIRGAKRPSVKLLSVYLLTSIIVINAGYGFRAVGGRLDTLPFNSVVMTELQTDAPWLRLPLPDAYVVGIDEQKSHADAGYSTYFRGKRFARGFWYYYLYAGVIKQPVPLLLAIVSSVFFFTQNRHPFKSQEEGLLVVPSIVIIAVLSSQDGMHLHYRYIIPAMPFLFVLAGALPAYAAPKLRERTVNSAILLLMIWSLAVVFSSHPNHIGYFNTLVGGSENGTKHLADSNVDWGQDLILLREWLDENSPRNRIALAYFGPVNPSVYGVDYCTPKAFTVGMRRTPEQPCCDDDTIFLVISANLCAGGNDSVHFVGGGVFSSESVLPVCECGTMEEIIGNSLFVYRTSNAKVLPTD